MKVKAFILQTQPFLLKVFLNSTWVASKKHTLYIYYFIQQIFIEHLLHKCWKMHKYMDIYYNAYMHESCIQCIHYTLYNVWIHDVYIIQWFYRWCACVHIYVTSIRYIFACVCMCMYLHTCMSPGKTRNY